MGELIVIGMDVRVASKTTFIPGAEAKRNHAILTIINNRGINSKTNQPIRDEITLNFWNKYAGVAAFYLYPGKQINFRGRLQSYTTDTGTVNAAGKKILNRKIEVVVDNMQLLGDSLKEINRRIGINSAALKSAGRMQPHELFNAEELLRNPENIPVVDFNPAISAQTGLYGKARVYDKTRKFWDQYVTNAPYAAPANNEAAMAAKIADLERKLAGITTPVMPPVDEAPSIEPTMMEVGADVDIFAS